MKRKGTVLHGKRLKRKRHRSSTAMMRLATLRGR